MKIIDEFWYTEIEFRKKVLSVVFARKMKFQNDL